MVGVVETVRTGWQKPFQNLQELTDILAGTAARSAARGLPGSADRKVVGKRRDANR